MTGDSSPTDDAIALVRRIAARESWQDHYGKRWEDEAAEIVAKLDACSTDVPAGIARYRHVKRGGEYEVIGTASLQTVSGDLVDGSDLVIYRDGDGELWAREEGEFHDGRFALVVAPAHRGEAAEKEPTS